MIRWISTDKVPLVAKYGGGGGLEENNTTAQTSSFTAPLPFLETGGTLSVEIHLIMTQPPPNYRHIPRSGSQSASRGVSLQILGLRHFEVTLILRRRFWWRFCDGGLGEEFGDG